jgi:hypothetical protein
MFILKSVRPLEDTVQANDGCCRWQQVGSLVQVESSMHIGPAISQMDPYRLACRTSGPAQSVRFVVSALEQSVLSNAAQGQHSQKKSCPTQLILQAAATADGARFIVLSPPFCERQIVSSQWVFTQESRRIRERWTFFSTTARFGLRYLQWQDYRKSQSDRNLLLPTLFSSLTSRRGILC